MKNLKRIFGALLTLVLSFCMISAVSAAGEGSITIENATVGKNYEIYKIFDLTYSGTKVAYTIDSNWTAFFEGEGSKYIVAENNEAGDLNQITIGSATKYINITESNKAEFAQDALKYAATLKEVEIVDGEEVIKSLNDGEQVATATTVTFTDLDLGYYLVYPEGAADIKADWSSICSLTSTLPSAKVTVKAEYPTIEKEADKHNVDVGEVVTFTITGKVPNTTGYTQYDYIITDTMTEGLTIDKTPANFTVTFGEDTIDVTDKIAYTANGFVLSFDMTKYQGYEGKTITVTYKATVNEKAVTEDTTKNSATLTYSNDPKDNTNKFTTPPEEEIVYSSKINVIKIDAKLDENGKEVKLAGAEFVLKNAAGEYYQAIGADGQVMTNVSTTEGVVTVNWVADQKNATVLRTEEDGTIMFKGIKNGTYYLVETKAPEGYNKLTGPETIKVGYNEDGTSLIEGNTSETSTIENNAGTQLPITGGMGTTLFIVIGSLLAIVSAIILVTNKRMAKEM